MADHYYTENPEAAHAYRMVPCDLKGRTLTLKTDAGVFSREHLDPGSSLLIETVPARKGRILDLGCGYGPIGIAFAAAEPECSVVMSDVNRRSLELAQENLDRNGIRNARTVFSNGCSELEGTFDLILSNPPIRIGKQALQSMWTDCYGRLNEGGSLYIVIRKKQGAPSAKQFLASLFGNCETVERQGGYHVLHAVRSKGEKE
ncbi:MAG: class I SAM-dependent methyltransferase [Clostridia bacterium]|nr:class I SAM-dependent methyltransferase [Clostridia bacterium]